MDRECPRHFVPMQSEVITGRRDTAVEVCPECEGIYLDRKEILRLTGNEPLFRLTTTDLGLDSDSKLLCPACGGIMDAEHPGGIEIDVCMTCNGVWLDRGELDQLQKLSHAEVAEYSPEKSAELERASHVKANRRAQQQRQLGFLRWLLRGR